MKKLILLLNIVLIFNPMIYSQTYDIKFKVETETGESFEQINVLVLKTDSSLIKGDAFQTKEITIKGINNDSVILYINTLSFSEKYLNIINSKHDKIIDLGIIHLTDNKLNEIVIKGNTPLISFDGDKTILNVENTSFSNSGSAEDILKKSAKVSIDQNNTISVFGKGEAKVYINDKQIVDYEELRNLNSNDILRIEVITNPSAKYDADAKAVINIVTKSNYKKGFYGYTNSYFTVAEYFRYYGNIYLSYRNKNLFVSGYYSVNPYKQYYKDQYSRYFDYDTTYIKMENTLEKVRHYYSPHTYSADIGYELGKLGKLGLRYSGYTYKGDEETLNINDVDKENNSYKINTSTNSDLRTQRNIITVEYLLKTDTLGSNLKLSYDFSNFSHYKNDKIYETISGNLLGYMADKINTNKTDLFFNSGCIDYLQEIPKIKSSVSLGGKYVNITSKSQNEFLKYIDNVWVINTLYSQLFDYEENLIAGYVILNNKFGKFDIKTGIRYESNNLIGKIESLQKKYEKQFPGFFPSFVLNYQWTKNLATSFSYSKKVRRPNYQSLQPFTIYIDSLSYYVGNPELESEYPNSFDFTLSYRNMASVNLSYIRTSNPIYMFIYPDENNDGVTYVTQKNLDLSEKIALTLTIPYETKFWTIYNSVGYSISKVDYVSKNNDIIIKNNKPLFYVYTYNKFSIFKDINLYFTYQYNSSGIDGIFEFESKHIVSAGIYRSFFNKKLKIQFIYNDIFKTDVLHSNTTLNNLYLTYDSYYDASYFRFVLTYNFGKEFKEKKAQTGIGDELNRIKNEF